MKDDDIMRMVIVHVDCDIRGEGLSYSTSLFTGVLTHTLLIPTPIIDMESLHFDHLP